MTAPSAFSTVNPKLQIVWDSTSLKALMSCPRQYQYTLLEHWKPSGVHLEFGGMFASAVETYKKSRAIGATKEQATLLAIQQVMNDSWINSLDHCEVCDDAPGHCTYCTLSGEPHGKPWGGNYENLWHCTGTTPFKNAKGNKAKCPYSHKGKWQTGPAPGICSCGSDIEVVRTYVPNDPVKNRETLVRLVAWYCDEQPEDLNAGWHPLVFPNGKPAVELSWKLPLPYKAKTGEAYVLSGHLDSIMSNGMESFGTDNKTTKSALGKSYFEQYAPNIQMDTYDVAGNVLFKELKFRGMLVEAAQISASGATFGSQTISHTDAYREEYLQELKYWLGQAEYFAENDYWPMNRASCYLCPFKSVCSKDPKRREAILNTEFTKGKPWNPMEDR